MAKYAHVKKGLGTRAIAETKTAREAGAFGDSGLEAGDVYADLVSVNANAGLSDGDFVIFSDLHDSAYGADIAFSLSASLTLKSVDDTSAGVYKKGAKESTSSTKYLVIQNSSDKIINCYGVDLIGGDRLDPFFLIGISSLIDDCAISIVSGYIRLESDGSLVHIRNSDINLGSGDFSISGGSKLLVDGGTLIGTKSGSIIESSGGQVKQCRYVGLNCN